MSEPIDAEAFSTFVSKAPSFADADTAISFRSISPSERDLENCTENFPSAIRLCVSRSDVFPSAEDAASAAVSTLSSDFIVPCITSSDLLTVFWKFVSTVWYSLMFARTSAISEKSCQSALFISPVISSAAVRMTSATASDATDENVSLISCCIVVAPVSVIFGAIAFFFSFI